MRYVVMIIIEAHLYMIVILLVSYILEKMFKIRLLIDSFRWKKSDYLAGGAADFYSLLYFLFSLLFLLFDLYVRKTVSENYTFWKWLIIMIPLTILFRICYFKFQGRDPTKKGFHTD